jgi:hypothetical protein
MADIEVDEEETPAHVTVVYDPRDGRVAHVHEFFGKGFDPDECAQVALGTIQSFGLPTDGLEVLHPARFRMREGMRFRVDLKSRKVVASPAPTRQSEIADRVKRRDVG